MTNKEIEAIQQDIRDLRDADFHVCPADLDDTQECTCNNFDKVIDKLDILKDKEERTNNYKKYNGWGY